MLLHPLHPRQNLVIDGSEGTREVLAHAINVLEDASNVLVYAVDVLEDPSHVATNTIDAFKDARKRAVPPKYLPAPLL